MRRTSALNSERRYSCARKEGSLVSLIERHYDAARLNEIVNHPAIFPHAVGAAAAWPVDLAHLFERYPGIIVLIGNLGAALLVPLGEGHYDCHFAVLPTGRGRWCREASRDVLRHAFEVVDAELLIFRCPRGNLAAHAGARMMGAECRGTTAPEFPTEAGLVPYDVFLLSRGRWLAQTGRLN